MVLIKIQIILIKNNNYMITINISKSNFQSKIFGSDPSDGNSNNNVINNIIQSNINKLNLTNYISRTNNFPNCTNMISNFR